MATVSAPTAIGIGRPRRRGRARWLAERAREALLRVPLAAKLAGANLLIAGATLVAAATTRGAASEGDRLFALAVALIVGLSVNALLVVLALRPLRALEDTAKRITAGDLAARVPDSPLADRDMARTRHALNHVLDDLAAERRRIRRLASLALKAQDEERARVARELNDSTAQTIAAVALELSVASRECGDPQLSERLRRIRDAAGRSVEEIRTLAQTVYPRVLQDLGLPAALERLARLTRESSDVETYVSIGPADIPPAAAAVLYRVARESLVNAVRHGSPSVVHLRLFVDGSYATLHVVDDGVGFDTLEASQVGGVGIFAMRERVALAGGTLAVVSTPGDGTRVTARVPLVEVESQ
jgi:signal transduction histidine kinase